MSTCSMHFYPNWVLTQQASERNLFLALVSQHTFDLFVLIVHFIVFKCFLDLMISQTYLGIQNHNCFCFVASLAPSLSDDLLAKATLQVVQLLKNRGAKSEITRTNIQMIGSLRYFFISKLWRQATISNCKEYVIQILLNQILQMFGIICFLWITLNVIYISSKCFICFYRGLRLQTYRIKSDTEACYNTMRFGMQSFCWVPFWATPC